MAAIKGRRKRLDLSPAERTKLQAEVSLSMAALVENTAAATGLSKGWVLDRILAHVPVDERGVAIWATEAAQQGVLQIEAA